MGIKLVDLIELSSGAERCDAGDRAGGVLFGSQAVSEETLGFADRPHGRGAILDRVLLVL
jgi:hypothetical protein